MNLLKTVPFAHNGKNYEIRVFSDSHTMTVKTFLDGNEANGFSHSVTFPVAHAMKRTTGVEPLEVLIEDAKRDILEDRWQQFLAGWNKIVP